MRKRLLVSVRICLIGLTLVLTALSVWAHYEPYLNAAQSLLQFLTAVFVLITVGLFAINLHRQA